MAGYDDNIPLQTFEKTSTIKSNDAIKRKSKWSLFFKTIFTFIVSAIFTILLLVLFLFADGKSIDYTIIGLKIPSLVSFLLSVNLVFIASGISTAVSEYKWVLLKNGAKLSLIDVYDDCTRGLSGFSKAFKLFYFDWVLILAFVFHLGLLIVSPASQEILKPISYNETIGNSSKIVFNYLQPFEIAGRSPVWNSAMPPKMNGLATNGYLVASSFSQAANMAKSVPIFTCPNGALECQYSNVLYISNKLTCAQVDENETAIALKGGITPTVIVLKEYYTHLNVTVGAFKFPKFLYAGEMVNRTYWDLANYTGPMMPGFNNLPWLFANETDYDPQYRPYVGDQVFIMAHGIDDELSLTPDNYTTLTFKKCHFNSSLVNSTWITQNGTLVKTDHDTSSTPIVFDYDNVLGNNLALNINRINKTSTSIMVNAYLMQQSLLAELIAPKYSTMYEYLRAYELNFKNISKATIFEAFLNDAARTFDYAYFQSPYVGNQASLFEKRHDGIAIFANQPIYIVDKASCFILCFSLFLPILWWLAVWIMSMSKMNGVGRGNSQVALLAMSLTSEAEQALRGLSLLDGDDAFRQAHNVHVRLGVVRDYENERLACGLKDEKNLSSLQN